jgi:hypothetical protein
MKKRRENPIHMIGLNNKTVCGLSLDMINESMAVHWTNIKLACTKGCREYQEDLIQYEKQTR